MEPKNYPTPCPTISEVKVQFKIWRRTRKSPRPIPEKLWAAAVGLTAKHSISQVSKELVLDYSALKKRVPIKNKDSAAKNSFGKRPAASPIISRFRTTASVVFSSF